MQYKKLSLAMGASVVVAASLVYVPMSQAGGIIKIDDDKSFSIGLGLRTSFDYAKGSTVRGGGSENKNFQLENMQLFMGGQVAPDIKFTVNGEAKSGNFVLIDAVAQWEPSQLLNVWMGQFLPPSDRANFGGPFYLNTWAFPGVAHKYPMFAGSGRDTGLAVWGQIDGGKFKYQVGAFEGINNNSFNAAPTETDSPLLTARFTYNFLDPEPGYYASSTYYGLKDVVALGFVVMLQENAVIQEGDTANFEGWNVDLLAEKSLPGGSAATFEAAYYNYDTNRLKREIFSDPSDSPVYTFETGSSFLASIAYLVPGKYGPGKLQPALRIQRYTPDIGDDVTRTDIGLNYILDGHNARVSAYWVDDVGDDKFLQLGVQLQL